VIFLEVSQISADLIHWVGRFRILEVYSFSDQVASLCMYAHDRGAPFSFIWFPFVLSISVWSCSHSFYPYSKAYAHAALANLHAYLVSFTSTDDGDFFARCWSGHSPLFSRSASGQIYHFASAFNLWLAVHESFLFFWKGTEKYQTNSGMIPMLSYSTTRPSCGEEGPFDETASIVHT